MDLIVECPTISGRSVTGRAGRVKRATAGSNNRRPTTYRVSQSTLFRHSAFRTHSPFLALRHSC